jgi:hypothetical protein
VLETLVRELFDGEGEPADGGGDVGGPVGHGAVRFLVEADRVGLAVDDSLDKVLEMFILVS